MSFRSKPGRFDQSKIGYGCFVELFIDPTDKRARSLQLYEQIRAAIVEDRLAAGDRLTPTRIAAADLGVSRSTVSEAYRRLVAEGYVEGHAGGGTVVSRMPPPAIRRPRKGTALRPTARAAGIRSFGQPTGGPSIHDLRPGSVDPSLFPTTAWRRCLVRALDRPPGQYGDPLGAPELRSVLASWVNRSRGVTATGDEVVVTSGTGHGVDLVARVLVDPGAVVAVEEPGYPPVVELLRSHALQVAGVPVDGNGIVVDAIPRRARLVYVTPSHQYPLGAVMSRARRLELLRWATRNDAAIIEDDYDSELRYTSRPLEPLQRLDRDGRVIYTGTFSKILSPALRLGFLVAPPSLVPAIAANRQVCDWSPPGPTQTALAAMITDGHLDRLLRRSRAVYGERYRRWWAALGATLPAGYRRLPSQAGLHVAVVNPDAPGDPDLIATANARGIDFGSLRLNYHSSDPVGGLLLGFGAVPTATVPHAAEAVADLLAAAGRSRPA